MGKVEKTLERVLRGTSDNNIDFNLQPRGSQAKPYQVKQVREIILAYRLAEE